MSDILRKILNDVRVELSDEFDRNFSRKAFFDQNWSPRKYHQNKGSLMMVTGKLRRSILSRTSANSVSWESSEPYAAIHNYGGEITVTAKMKRYFWYKYKVTKDNYWKYMALMKVGTTITIPKRQFIGDHKIVREATKEIINRNIKEYANNLFGKIKL